MKDLIERLRSYLPLGDGSLWSKSSRDCQSAATALESQAAEIESLRAALAQCVEALHRSTERMLFAEPWSAAEIDIAFAQKAIDKARSVLGGE